MGEGGGVVDAVADHRHDAVLLQPPDDVDLVLGQDVGDDVGRMPTAAATVAAARSLSPVSSTGRSPRARSSAIAAALVGLTASATTSTPRAAPSQPTSTGVRPAASASSLPGAGRRRRSIALFGQEPLAADDDAPAVDDAGDAEALHVGEPVDGGQRQPPAAGAVGDRPGDRVLGCVLEGAGEPQHVVGMSPAAATASTSVIGRS